MNVQLTGMACALLIVVSASGWRAQSAGVPADPPYPGFSLTDVNQTSDRFQMPVSPRDYLGRVSAWYFGDAF